LFEQTVKTLFFDVISGAPSKRLEKKEEEEKEEQEQEQAQTYTYILDTVPPIHLV